MKLTTILTLGAVMLATPAFAQAASQSANDSTSSQTAMNNTATDASVDNSSAASVVSSIPDTDKKYKNASRASDNQKEAETTKQLNQQMASANGIPKTQQ